MGKIKTKKTLLKRIKQSKTGKLMHEQVNTGHLKEKWSANKKYRKAKRQEQENKGHIKKFKKMLGKHAKS
jgi:ribosomal protein L35